jgi:O-glycosyl hydrolase
VPRTLLAICLLGPALSGCLGSGDDSGDEPNRHKAEAREGRPALKGEVTVTDRRRQTIEGWGAGVGMDNPLSPLAVPEGLSEDQLGRIDRLVADTAGVNLLRVFVPGDLGASQGHDTGPTIADRPKFDFMRRLSRYGVRFMLTGGGAPASLMHGPRLVEGGEAQYAAYLASVLRFAKDEIGAPFSYVAVANEPDNGASPLQMSPEQAARVYAGLAERIEAERLGTRLILGDNTGWENTLAYVPDELAAPRVRDASAAIASHSYSGTPADVRGVVVEAERKGLPVWQTEWTNDPCPDCPDEPRASMERALSWAQTITDHLTRAETEAWFTLKAVADSTHGAQAGMVVRQKDDPEEPFYATKRLHVFRHYSSAGAPGSQVVETKVRGTDLAALAFARDGGVAVVLANPSHGPVEIALDLGDRSGTLSRRRTDANEDFAELAPIEYERSSLPIRLPAESVTSLELG